MSAPSTPLVVLAAGGTGGHIFPAEALARELARRGLAVCLMTDPRGGRFGTELKDVPVLRIRAKSLGGSLAGKARGVIEMLIGFCQAWLILRRRKPVAVVGFGGYPSVPAVFAAAQLGIPVFLHEQNAVLGRANKVLAPLARKIALSFPQTAGFDASHAARAVFTGLPVRPAICALREIPYPPAEGDAPLHLLVMGGSQGAHVFSDVVPKAIALLPEHLRVRLVVSQQCRADDLENARLAYTALGMKAELARFFSDIPERLLQCHFVIGRSGASTVAELCAAGRPAILVPYPRALAGEQQANARFMAEAGAGWLIPEAAFTPEALAIRLESFLAAPTALTKAAEAARNLARIGAAEALAELVMTAVDIPAFHGENGDAPLNANRNAA